MIRAILPGELGNRLCAYAFGRVLAVRLRFRFEALAIPGFPQTAVQIPGEELLTRPCIWTGNWPFEAFWGRPVHPADFQRPAGYGIELSGLFNRFDLFADFQENLREDWLRLAAPLPPRESDDLVCHLALERAPSPGSPPKTVESLAAESSFSEQDLRQLVKVTKPKRLYLVAENSAHPFRTRLVDLKPEWFTGSELERLRFMHSFQRVAMGQSTLGWWSAFLGSAREIYFPRTEKGRWSHPAPAIMAHDPWWHGIDLRVPGDARFVFDW